MMARSRSPFIFMMSGAFRSACACRDRRSADGMAAARAFCGSRRRPDHRLPRGGDSGFAEGWYALVNS